MTKIRNDIRLRERKLKKLFKTLGCGMLAVSLSITNVSGVWATSSSKVEADRKEAEKNLDSAKQQVNELEKDKNAASNKVAEMNSDLSDLLTVIQLLESDMTSKQLEINQVQIDYDSAKKQEESQYTSMKKRIKYIYEAGDTEYFDILLKAKSMADLINKTEYVKELYDYDKKMLGVYQETKVQVAGLKDELEEEQSEMEFMQEEHLRQKSDLEVLISKKKKEVSNFDAQLVDAQKKANAYTKSLQEQTAKLKKVKEEEARKKAEEAARKRAEEASKQAVKPKSAQKGSSAPYVGAGPGAKSTGGTAQGRAVADYALKFVGNPYVYGGTSLTNGADCSGFTQSVYRNFGITLPRTSSEQSSWGTAVDYSDIQPGDLVFYAGHVAVSIGGGQIVHASTAKTGIKVSSVTYRTILGIRRPSY